MALQFTQTDTPRLGITMLADEVVRHIKGGERVAWLVPGGSNIPVSVAVMDVLCEQLDETQLTKLSIRLTDERYGPIGHKDSNWQQLIDAGFRFTTDSKPVLFGGTLEETVKAYEEDIEALFADTDHIIGQFGIGADGHIAGVLPHTIGVATTDPTIGYQSGALTRISLSLQTLSKLNSAYAFVFGASKAEAVRNLQTDMSLDDMPSQVLKSLPTAHVFTDQ